jgi:N-acetyl-1-D-myo-inositol-2-amino-2-deoxy-alpha-D-glucopyranoside deacetylase
MISQPDSPRRLLAVMAHPDDESFGPGATLALYSRRGVETYLVCATRGEAGAAPSDLRGYASKAEMREAELRCASRVLGLQEVRFLGYRDSGMAGSPENTHPDSTAMAPLDEMARKVARHIREIRPQVIITFDPSGGYGHPDHIAVHRATVEAFRLAGDPQVEIDGLNSYFPQKLYFHTFPLGWLKPLVRLLQRVGADPQRFGRNRDIDLVALAAGDVPVHAIIPTRSAAHLKGQAIQCHASQSGGMRRVAIALMVRLLGNKEYFSRVVPVQPPLYMERDLFEGVLQS